MFYSYHNFWISYAWCWYLYQGSQKFTCGYTRYSGVPFRSQKYENFKFSQSTHKSFLWYSVCTKCSLGWFEVVSKLIFVILNEFRAPKGFFSRKLKITIFIILMPTKPTNQNIRLQVDFWVQNYVCIKEYDQNNASCIYYDLKSFISGYLLHFQQILFFW